MIIGIASIRKPKVDAVKAVFGRLASRFGTNVGELSFLEIEVQSGVEETPKSLLRIMEGARVRTLNLCAVCRTQGKGITFAVGLEGGLFSVEDAAIGRQTFLQSWAYVASAGQESFGASGAILLPTSIAGPVVGGDQSLSDVINRAAQQNDVRSNQGTWGILTQDLITRQDSFEVALTSALAPFYNPAFYRAR